MSEYNMTTSSTESDFYSEYTATSTYGFNHLLACDDSSVSFSYVDYTQLPVVRHVFSVLYVIIIVLSLCGNAMVILTVARNRHMRTVTNCYVVNLATCDTLVAAFVMPLKALEYLAPAGCAESTSDDQLPQTSSWWSWSAFRSDSLCSLLYFLLPVFVFASVLTLIAISVER